MLYFSNEFIALKRELLICFISRIVLHFSTFNFFDIQYVTTLYLYGNMEEEGEIFEAERISGAEYKDIQEQQTGRTVEVQNDCLVAVCVSVYFVCEWFA